MVKSLVGHGVRCLSGVLEGWNETAGGGRNVFYLCVLCVKGRQEVTEDGIGNIPTHGVNHRCREVRERKSSGKKISK